MSRTEIANNITNLGERIGTAQDEITTAITKGFGKLDTLLESLGQTQTELADIRHQMRQLQEEARQARDEAEAARREASQARAAAAEAASRTTPRTEPETTAFDKLLDVAAGIAYAEIVCHRDHWDFLIAQAANSEHFRLPGDVDECDDGLVETDLSGRSIIAILDALWHKQYDEGDGTSVGTRRLAAKLYSRIGEALGQVTSGVAPAEQDGKNGVARIVIDDRPAPPGDNTSPPEAPSEAAADDDPPAPRDEPPTLSEED